MSRSLATYSIHIHPLHDLVCDHVSHRSGPPSSLQIRFGYQLTRPFRPGNGIIPVPDGNVGRFEDARQVARQSPSYAMSTLSVRDNTMPARPGYGTEGTPIIVYANYLPLTLKSDLVLYMYDMSKYHYPRAVGPALCLFVLKLPQIARTLVPGCPVR